MWGWWGGGITRCTSRQSHTPPLIYHLSNRKRFPCLHSLIQTREGLGEFETVMQTRDEVEGLHNRREFSQPLECLYQDMQTQEKVFYCFYRITFPRKKAKLSCLELWLKEKFLPVAKSCTRSLHALSVLVLQKKAFQNTRFSRLKCQLKWKINNTACFQRFYKIQPTRKWVNKVNLSSFSTQNLFQIRACVISARKA